MENTVYIENYKAPPFDVKEIMRYAGVKELTEDMDALFRECMEEIKGKLFYKVCHQEVPLCFCDGYADMGFLKTASRDIQKNLKGCSSVIVFAATIGIELDRMIAKYSAVSPAKAVCFQAIGAERIESLCNEFCKDIEARKKSEGRSIMPRFSPGYGDFPLEAQKEIFSLLDPSRKIGLTLSGSLLMSPTKSVTAIMGVCDGKGVSIKKHSCMDCDKYDCEFRRKV